MEALSPLLTARGLGVKRQNRWLVQQVALEVRAGELVGIIGPNGAGKSTLLQVLAALIKPEQGVVEFQGRDLHTLAPATRARQIAWLAQQGEIHWALSVERLVALGRLPHLTSWQAPNREDQAWIEHVLQQLDLQTLRERDATTLSGGERARVLLARALVAEPQLLLADEPVAALDMGHQLQTLQYLREFAQASRACVVVLHDLALAVRFCDRVYVLQQGQIVAHGMPHEVITPTLIEQVYGVSCVMGYTPKVWIVPVAFTPNKPRTQAISYRYSMRSLFL